MIEEKLASMMLKTCEELEGACKEYYQLDSDYESQKKLLECEFSEVVRDADGSSEAEKKRNGLATPEYKKLVADLNSVRRKRNLAKACYLGLQSKWETYRSALSYKKSLIDKGIIS